MRTIFLIATLLYSYGCDMNNQKLRLVNYTKDTIYYDLMLDTKIEKGQYLYKIAPFDTVWPNFVMGRGEGVWEYKINSKSKDSTLHIYVFTSNLVTDSMIKHNNYKHLTYKIKELDSLQWIVIYK